jgi:hypothetical protein
VRHPDQCVLLPQIVGGVGIVAPIQLRLQAVMAGRGGRVPDERSKHGTVSGPFDPQINASVGNGKFRVPEAYMEITKIHAKSNGRRIVGVVPDAHDNLVVGGGLQIARSNRIIQHIEELDVRIVPCDREALAHQPQLRINHRIGADVVTGRNFRATATAVRATETAVQGAAEGTQKRKQLGENVGQ